MAVVVEEARQVEASPIARQERYRLQRLPLPTIPPATIPVMLFASLDSFPLTPNWQAFYTILSLKAA